VLLCCCAAVLRCCSAVLLCRFVLCCCCSIDLPCCCAALCCCAAAVLLCRSVLCCYVALCCAAVLLYRSVPCCCAALCCCAVLLCRSVLCCCAAVLLCYVALCCYAAMLCCSGCYVALCCCCAAVLCRSVLRLRCFAAEFASLRAGGIAIGAQHGSHRQTLSSRRPDRMTCLPIDARTGAAGPPFLYCTRSRSGRGFEVGSSRFLLLRALVRLLCTVARRSKSPSSFYCRASRTSHTNARRHEMQRDRRELE
jgi:hypothetical protein